MCVYSQTSDEKLFYCFFITAEAERTKAWSVQPVLESGRTPNPLDSNALSMQFGRRIKGGLAMLDWTVQCQPHRHQLVGD